MELRNKLVECFGFGPANPVAVVLPWLVFTEFGEEFPQLNKCGNALFYVGSYSMRHFQIVYICKTK